MKFFLIGLAIVVGGSILILLVNVGLMYLMEWLYFNIFFTDKEDR